MLIGVLVGLLEAAMPPTAAAQPLDAESEAPTAGVVVAAPHCRSASVTLAFDFEGAAPMRCVVESERAFSLLVTPEHAPPINPSPWYAFRYEAAGGAAVTVHLRYLGAQHRYQPKWRGSGDPALLASRVSEDGTSATLTLPSGEGTVSAQELFGAPQYEAQLARLARLPASERLVLGVSHDGRPIEAVRLGTATAPRLIVLIGRQHPPEVTGALAMEAFLARIAVLAEEGQIDLSKNQFLIVPLLNPDGVARGHWRANLGGKDLNRDWGDFSQPETRAVREWLEARPAGVRPAAMVDFHSTNRNLFYVQGEEETSPEQERFLAAWLGGKEEALAGYRFTIERRNANPGSGTAKNWFHATYAIPSYTYEVADDANRESLRSAAEALAEGLVDVLGAPETQD